jgi:hypothetical protein
MPTAWTPFPIYSLIFSPTIGRALESLKDRYTPGTDYYQIADYEPPFMSEALIADFHKVYDENLQKNVDMYNKECGASGLIRLSDHFHEVHYALGTPDCILKVEKACNKVRQLVGFERWVRQSILAKQQREEQEAERVKQAWGKLQDQFSATNWLMPGDRNLIMFMATRIQKLESTVERLIKENEDLYRILTETRI